MAKRSAKRFPWSCPGPRCRPNRRKRAVIGAKAGDPTARPIRSETRARLISGMANARTWLNELASGRMADTRAIALRQGCSERHGPLVELAGSR
jgi:site-specific DNA recombinase